MSVLQYFVIHCQFKIGGMNQVLMFQNRPLIIKFTGALSEKVVMFVR